MYFYMASNNGCNISDSVLTICNPIASNSSQIYALTTNELFKKNLNHIIIIIIVIIVIIYFVPYAWLVHCCNFCDCR